MWRALCMSVVCIAWIIASSAAATGDDDFAEAKRAIDARQHEKAMQLLRPLARTGDPRAQHLLGYLYEYSDADLSDLKKARHWYEKSAAQDYPPGIGRLGSLIVRTEKSPEKKELGWNLVEKAAKLNDAYAQVFHSTGPSMKNLQQIRYWRIKAANQKEWLGALFLIYAYMPSNGKNSNFPEAYFWALIYERLVFEERQFTSTPRENARAKITDIEAAESERRAAAWLTARGVAP